MRDTDFNAELELALLPAGRTVVDATGDVWEKTPAGQWYFEAPEGALNIPSVLFTAAELLHVWGPVRIVDPQPGDVQVYHQPPVPNAQVSYVGQDGQLHDLGVTVIDTDFTWDSSERDGFRTSLSTNYSVDLKFTLEDTVQALKAFGSAWNYASPKAELLYRLNTMLQGDHPGKPVHWRGL